MAGIHPAREEADRLLHLLHQEFGAKIDGVTHTLIIPEYEQNGTRTAMRRDHFRYPNEIEWFSYYIKFRLDNILDGIDFTQHWEAGRLSRFSWVEGNYRWMIRIKYNDDSGFRFLSDVDEMERIFFHEGNGLGLIILTAEALQGAVTGTSTNKLSAHLIQGDAYYFPTIAEFQLGLRNNWLESNYVGMGEPGGTGRPNPKYGINYNVIPPDFLIFQHNFAIPMP